MALTVDAGSPESPPARRHPTPLSLRALSYFAYQYKRTWRSSITTSFLFPILYLAAMGVGLGSLVDKHSHTVDGVTYLVFLAPGLLAATAMQIGANEAMYPIMGAIKWMRTYFAMLATPLRVVDVLRGHMGWIAVRLTLVSAIYLAVMAAFGDGHSPLGGPGPSGRGRSPAWPSPSPSPPTRPRQERDVGFTTLYRFGLIPLFLFSGTFFPVSQLPAWLQPVATRPRCTTASTCVGDWCWATSRSGTPWSRSAYLVAVIAIGYRLAAASFEKRLIV